MLIFKTRWPSPLAVYLWSFCLNTKLRYYKLWNLTLYICIAHYFNKYLKSSNRIETLVKTLSFVEKNVIIFDLFEFSLWLFRCGEHGTIKPLPFDHEPRILTTYNWYLIAWTIMLLLPGDAKVLFTIKAVFQTKQQL